MGQPDNSFRIEHEGARHLEWITGLGLGDLAPTSRDHHQALPQARPQQRLHADLRQAERSVARLTGAVDQTGVTDVELLAELSGELRGSGRHQIDVGLGSIEITCGALFQLDELIMAGDSSVVAQKEENRRAATDEFRNVDLATAGIQKRDGGNLRAYIDHPELS